jgi:xanthine/CO dehydrogenase XdhC/CoxF family maturation factor
MSELFELREVAATLRSWHDKGRPYALAQVVAVFGSAPRDVGATLAVDEAGIVAGNVSGGCVEAEVYELCREVLRTGGPSAAVSTPPAASRSPPGSSAAARSKSPSGGSIRALTPRSSPSWRPARRAPGTRRPG